MLLDSHVLKRVVAVVKRLCLREKNEKFGDPHNRNYCMILKLLAKFNQGSGSTNYLSKTVCNEFIH